MTARVISIGDPKKRRYEATLDIKPRPQWIEQGPGSIAPGEQFNQAGAIHAVLVDPDNTNRIFVGSVNGGIWTTSNGTAPAPTWKTSTDHAASLSIADLKFDPLDKAKQTIWAAIGTYSSWDFGHGGPLVGLLRSQNGGLSWVNLGGAGLSGRQLRAVQPTTFLAPEQVVLAGTDAGIFRSIDGGATSSALARPKASQRVDRTSEVLKGTPPVPASFWPVSPGWVFSSQATREPPGNRSVPNYPRKPASRSARHRELDCRCQRVCQQPITSQRSLTSLPRCIHRRMAARLGSPSPPTLR